MRVFHCHHCQQLLFFENSQCVRCGHRLAFAPERFDLLSLDPVEGDPSRWTSPGAPGTTFKLCTNYTRYDVCNWALRADEPEGLCSSCRLTRTIPNLSQPGNDRLWYKLEVAKRRLVYTLEQLGLPLRRTDAGGLTFDLRDDVMTGHAGGIVTVNLREADDAERVKQRIALNEPYRTLLGHFRHESGHYYWDELVRDAHALAAFRETFGDERASYQEALDRNYREGPPAGWQERFVSAYAAMHPWEDWAETWAHYLHMVDTLETAAACGVAVTPRRPDEPSLFRTPNPVEETHVPFERMLASWSTLTYVLNNLNRGLGNDDAYPFVLAGPTVTKLRFVHDTVARHGVPSARLGY